MEQTNNSEKDFKVIQPGNIYQGDCLGLMKDIPEGSIDLIITDPPYGVGFNKGFDDSIEHIKSSINQWLSEFYRVLKNNSHCYIFIPVKEADLWLSSVRSAGFTLMNILSTRTYTNSVYLKNNFSFNNQLIIYCSKGKAKRLNEVDFIPTSESWQKDKRNKNPKPYTYSYPSFLPYFSNEKATSKSNNAKERHPCSKSVDFLEFLIRLSSNGGEVVLDPFLGGASTVIAAINTSRQYIGMELSEEYFNISQQRIQNEITKEEI